MPTKLKVLHGERRPSRLNAREPQPTGLPSPDGLSDDARAVWDRVMRDYGYTGIITAADQDVLQAYCEAVVRYSQAAKLLEQSGPLVRGARTGDLIKNPLHQIVRDNAILIRAFGRELGLTPSARTGLQVSDGAEDDPLEAWAAK